MKNTNILYSKKESKAYILFYCAQIDFTYTKAELEYIKSKTNRNSVTKACNDISTSNDFKIIQKIQLLVDKYWKMESDKDCLLRDIKALFLVDGKWNQIERNLYRGLNQLFAHVNH